MYVVASSNTEKSDCQVPKPFVQLKNRKAARVPVPLLELHREMQEKEEKKDMEKKMNLG